MRIAMFLIVCGLIGAVFVGQSDAAVTLVTSRTALAGTHHLDWDTIGGDDVAVPDPLHMLSHDGVPATLSETGSPFYPAIKNGVDYRGNFSQGDPILCTGKQVGGGSGPIMIDFGSTLITNFGLQIQSYVFGSFTGILTTSGGSETEVGASNGKNDGSAILIFIGLHSTTPFNEVTVGLLSSPGSTGDFFVNPAQFTVAFPKPTSLALALAAALWTAAVDPVRKRPNGSTR